MIIHAWRSETGTHPPPMGWRFEPPPAVGVEWLWLWLWSWQRFCNGMWNAMFYFVECLEAWKLGSVEACTHQRVTASRASTPIIDFAAAGCSEM